MKIALLGYGKMGKIIESIAVERAHNIVLKVDVQSPSSWRQDLLKADIAIDFSSPQVGFEHVMACLAANVPVVSGTTGWQDQYEAAVQSCLAQKGALLHASNFSVGVNIFFQINKQLAKWMASYPSYTPSMQEIHHLEKKDAPSGTAVTLLKGITENYAQWSHYALTANPSTPPQVSIDAIREGEVKGTHEVTWTSEIDQISIRHEAFNRQGFAVGAVMAAEWLLGKEGVFTMEDVLFG